jgi:hypothetical protein
MVPIPRSETLNFATESKVAAVKATMLEYIAARAFHRAKVTTLSLAIAELREKAVLPEGVGKYSKDLDIALPGSHTQTIYKNLRWKSAKTLAQLRTGMCRYNEYLSF